MANPEHAVSEFNKALVETQISMLETGQITPDYFKINVNILLQINIDDL